MISHKIGIGKVVKRINNHQKINITALNLFACEPCELKVKIGHKTGSKRGLVILLFLAFTLMISVNQA